MHEPSAIIVYQDALHDKNSSCRAISKMAAEWRNFKSKMKAKIIDKGKGKKKDTISAFNEENDTSVVQRLIDLGVGETTCRRNDRFPWHLYPCRKCWSIEDVYPMWVYSKHKWESLFLKNLTSPFVSCPASRSFSNLPASARLHTKNHLCSPSCFLSRLVPRRPPYYINSSCKASWYTMIALGSCKI